MPTFSIIIPTHNRAPLVQRAVRSVLNQAGCDFEAIVVDDGSTDDTIQALSQFKQDPRFTILLQDHQGATTARNLGAAHATGQYLLFLDSDDELVPNALRQFTTTLSSRPAVVCSSALLVASDGTPRKLKQPRDMGPPYENQHGLFLAGTFVVCRQVFEQVGGFAAECRATQHKEFALRLIPHCLRTGRQIATLEQPTVRVHDHEGEHLRTSLLTLLEGRLYTIRKHEKQLRKCPRHYSYWCETAAVFAIRLKRYRDARWLLWRAMRNRPTKARIYARLILVHIPPLARLPWRRIAEFLQLRRIRSKTC